MIDLHKEPIFPAEQKFTVLLIKKGTKHPSHPDSLSSYIIFLVQLWLNRLEFQASRQFHLAI
jgi:hypothetical protein